VVRDRYWRTPGSCVEQLLPDAFVARFGRFGIVGHVAGNRAGADLYPILRRRALQATGATLLATAAASAMLMVIAGLSPLAPIKALAVPVALVALAGPSLAEHPTDRLGPANSLTLARAVLVALLAAFVEEPAAEAYSLALVVAAGVAFGMDWLDGRVARATGSASPFGARLDMELDGITVLVLCALAMGLGRAGAWVLLAGAARYLFIGAGLVWPWMTRELPPDPRRPWACGVGITLLVACLAPWPLAWFGTLLAAVGVLALVGSFAIDVVWLWRHR
jgi:phosphatidylglycerophosphate synthase